MSPPHRQRPCLSYSLLSPEGLEKLLALTSHSVNNEDWANEGMALRWYISGAQGQRRSSLVCSSGPSASHGLWIIDSQIFVEWIHERRKEGPIFMPASLSWDWGSILHSVGIGALGMDPNEEKKPQREVMEDQKHSRLLELLRSLV